MDITVRDEPSDVLVTRQQSSSVAYSLFVRLFYEPGSPLNEACFHESQILEMLSPALQEGLKAYAIGPKIRSIRLLSKIE